MCLCMWVSVGVHVCKGRKNEMRLSRLACVFPRLPFTHLFKLQSKMGNMKLGPHSSFWLVPQPRDPVRDTGPITINTHFLGLTAKTGCLLCAVIDRPWSVSGKVWRMLKKTHLFSLGATMTVCTHACTLACNPHTQNDTETRKLYANVLLMATLTVTCKPCFF